MLDLGASRRRRDAEKQAEPQIPPQQSEEVFGHQLGAALPKEARLLGARKRRR